MADFATGASLILNPRSPAQQRAFIAALKARDAEFQDAIDALLNDVETLDAQGGPVDATFNATIAVGVPIRVDSNARVSVAAADSVSNANVTGLVFKSAALDEVGQYVPEGGRVSLDDWSAITGAVQLSPNAEYFLSTSAGQLTTTAPTNTGEVFIKVGRALNVKIFQVELGESILL